MTLADELNVTAWEALPLATRIAGAAVMRAELDAARARAEVERLAASPLTEPKDLEEARARARTYADESRRERSLFARTAKATVDAGVMGQLQRNLELEGQLLGGVLVQVLDQLPGLTADDRVRALTEAHRILTEGDGPDSVLSDVEARWADGAPQPRRGEDGDPGDVD